MKEISKEIGAGLAIVAAAFAASMAVVACRRDSAAAAGGRDMSCDTVAMPGVDGGLGKRCENDEAVCYVSAAGGLSCWRKG